MAFRFRMVRAGYGPSQRNGDNSWVSSSISAATPARHHEHDAVGKPLVQEIEEPARQISAAPAVIGGVSVEPIERVPMPRLEGAPRQGLDLEAVRHCVAPLAADLLALPGIERREK